MAESRLILAIAKVFLRCDSDYLRVVTKVLLIIHVVAVILAIGPIAVSASMFPAVARRGERAGLLILNRVCRVYAAVGIVVPMFGLTVANVMGVLGSPWVITSIVLTAAAAALLVFAVLPAQQQVLSGEAAASALRRLAMFTGLFNMLWVAVTVLMIVRSGSTTGV